VICAGGQMRRELALCWFVLSVSAFSPPASHLKVGSKWSVKNGGIISPNYAAKSLQTSAFSLQRYDMFETAFEVIH